MGQRGLKLPASVATSLLSPPINLFVFFWHLPHPPLHIYPPFLLMPEALTFSPPGLLLLRLLLCLSLTSSATLPPSVTASFFLTSPLISPSAFLLLHLLLHVQSCLSSPDTPNLHKPPPLSAFSSALSSTFSPSSARHDVGPDQGTVLPGVTGIESDTLECNSSRAP